jgi:hypothetical protein
MKNQFREKASPRVRSLFCAKIMCNAIESCLNWNLFRAKTEPSERLKEQPERDTLRRGEISRRKGNIKRCCWHRSVHSFGFYFTVRLAASRSNKKLTTTANQ